MSICRFPVFAVASIGALLVLIGCAATPTATPRVLIFGEQHDQVDQQHQVAQDVRALAARGTLAGVVLEMVEHGRDTTALNADADEAAVRDALAWNDKGWPWAQYGPVVMAAVRAGVPVRGGNLPRNAMRQAMGDTALDAALPADLREHVAQAVRSGHCGLLPEAQEPGMVRIQIARDQSMARTIRTVIEQNAERHVVLLTGAQHATRDRGVPFHLRGQGQLPAGDMRIVMFGPEDPGLVADEWRAAEVTPRPDPCEGLRTQLLKKAEAAAAAATPTSAAAAAASAPR